MLLLAFLEGLSHAHGELGWDFRGRANKHIQTPDAKLFVQNPNPV